MKPYYEDESVTLYHGDCIEVLRQMPDNSVDSVVTDPPYGLEFMGKEWDGADGFRRSLNAADAGRESAFGRMSKKAPEYKAGAVFGQWCEVWARECLRVLKPGGHLIAFGGSRTWHRLAAGVEDAGFEIRDSIAWLYGSGFPKSRNLDGEHQGWGTALKPAFEPIVVGRKPLIGTVAGNVLTHGTGALNINASRVAHVTVNGGNLADNPHLRGTKVRGAGVATGFGQGGEVTSLTEQQGRWPTNVLLEASQAETLDQQTGTLTSGRMRAGTARAPRDGAIYGKLEGDATTADTYGDSGGASRFFPTFHYEAKAPTHERPNVGGVQHPTVKPLDLMRWLTRLVTPVGGTVLEPFAGSGTTAEACIVEGFECIAIERDETYLPLIISRINKPIEVSLFGGVA